MAEPKTSILRPMHPERVCWGCDRYCPADNLCCGKDTVRTPHPMEMFGEDWMEWCEANGGGNTVERMSHSSDEGRAKDGTAKEPSVPAPALKAASR